MTGSRLRSLLVLLLVVGLLATGALPAAADDTLDELLEEIEEAEFSGSQVIITTWDGVTEVSVVTVDHGDGIVMVEQLLAVTRPFSLLEELLTRIDPDGVAGVDRRAFHGATTLAERIETVPRDEAWPQLIAIAAEECYGCAPLVTTEPPPEIARVTRAEESAWQAFQQERGPVAPDRAGVAEVAMLGMVEVCARLVEGRIYELEICGDIIAPFGTLEDLSAACEGTDPSGSAAGAVARALSAPDAFVLGVHDLASLVARLR